jgi:asparagine synthase (glutamine-hydrolysing)
LPTAWRGLRSRWRGEAPEWLSLSPIRPGFAAEVELAEHIAAAGTTGIMPRDLDSRIVQAHFLDHNRLLSLETRVAIRAHYGLDLRDPLADLDLVEFCLAIPREQYFIDGRDRSLARRVLADRLPPSVVNERRIGQQKPEWHARVTPQREAYAAELQRLERIPLAAALLDLPRLKSLVEDWPADAAAARARRFTYESLLPRAVQIGRFLRWLDGSNE